MTWTIAHALEVLRDEVNTAYPERSKISDGFIGDAAHAATPSDHNPNAANVVCAFDITHDPYHGCDGDRIFADLIARKHEDMKYAIWSRQVVRAYDKPGIPAWTIAPYTGTSPHIEHVHVSAGAGSDGQSAQPYDDRFPWGISVTPTPAPLPPTPPPSEDSMQFFYAQLVEAPEVYLVNVAAKPRHFERFADAEYWAKIGGHTVTEFGMADKLGADGAGEFRQGVLVAADNTRARTLFGFT